MKSCKPIRDGNIYINNEIPHEVNGERDKYLSTEKCLNKSKSHIKDIIPGLENLIIGQFN